MLRTCVHCGICLPQCPTYRVLGEEMDSPRGRLYLMRAVAEGRLEPTETYAHHLDLCLACRACETACPAGVKFGALLETARADLERRGRPGRDRWLQGMIFALFPRPERLAPALGLARRYRHSGLQRLVRRSRVLGRFPRLAALDALLEGVPIEVTLPEFVAARGRARGRVGVLTGCVQRYLFSDVSRATIGLLSLAGWDVVIPRAQGCCGALELHAGRVDAFRGRAAALAAAFPDDVDWIVTDAAGCGSAIRDYGHWLPGAPAARLGARARDVTELLVDARLPLGPLPLTVTYHDACHLAHGQQVRSAPRELLGRIPGLTLVELRDSDLCCGSAGVYNILQPDMADRLLDLKLARIVETGARVVAAGNPGCLMQIAKGARARGLELEVVHPVTLLARSAGVGAP
ncbi:MAG TPA: heterodisulfide reductase-related iron-sulfur binding cluster [Methylomirabilota bacterium]|nr:heterodisulfide reductase-related iron-sulfur binding cluster [Methylomirabilota bacterium]